MLPLINAAAMIAFKDVGIIRVAPGTDLFRASAKIANKPLKGRVGRCNQKRRWR
jgi:hypothetical protein